MSEMNEFEKVRDRVRGGLVGAYIAEAMGQKAQEAAGNKFSSPDMNGWRRIEQLTEVMLKHGLGSEAIKEVNAARRQAFEDRPESPGATLSSVVVLGLGRLLTAYAIGVPKKHDHPKIDLSLAYNFIGGLDAVSDDSAERRAPVFMLDRFYEKVFANPDLLGAHVTAEEVNEFLKEAPNDVFTKAMPRLAMPGVLKDMLRSVDEFDKDLGITLGSATQIACQAMALCSRGNEFEPSISDLLNYGIYGVHTSLVASVAGGFYGTHTGFSTIPKEWLRQHLGHDKAFELADKLCHAFIVKE